MGQDKIDDGENEDRASEGARMSRKGDGGKPKIGEVRGEGGRGM